MYRHSASITLCEQCEVKKNLLQVVNLAEEAVGVGCWVGDGGWEAKARSQELFGETNAQVFVKPAGLPVLPEYRPLMEKHTGFDSL